MFDQKDYLEYLNKIMEIEIGMQNEADQLQRLIKGAEARRLLKQLKADEVRHAKIVRKMIALVKK
ncbi:hypothetical protein EPO05_03485 [Patescibacteria group bacterium]|nr:MAG: hypothetical protein EPO05_03485 [Patescibacteria group bacterium]